MWSSIRQRCNNPKQPAYPNYGGRGIKICERWQSYKAFEADMMPKPSPSHTIERIDNDGPYSPENCCWATRAEQMRNRRNTIRLVVEGKEYLAMDLAKIAGIKTDSMLKRYRRGLSYEEIVSPIKQRNLAGLKLGPPANIAKAEARRRAE